MKRVLARLMAICPLALAPGRSIAAWTLQSSRAIEASPKGVSVVLRVFAAEGREVDLRVAVFDARRHALRVVDNPPDAAVTLAEAMRRGGFAAGINGGFFHADGVPLGLVVSDGRVIHGMERARLLSGVVAVTAEKPLLLRHAEYRFGTRTRQALQAGPFLIDGGRAVAGLDARRRDRRTAVLTDGGHRWALMASGSLTLRELADLLVSGEQAVGFKVARALNLDGGSSTAFWAACGGTACVSEMGYVRNFLAVAPLDGKRR